MINIDGQPVSTTDIVSVSKIQLILNEYVFHVYYGGGAILDISWKYHKVNREYVEAWRKLLINRLNIINVDAEFNKYLEELKNNEL